MNIRKAIAGFVATVALATLAAGMASAQLVGFANAGGNNPAAGNYITYTPSTTTSTGGFTLLTNNGFINNGIVGATSPVTINFGTLANVPGSYIPPDPTTGSFSQGLGAGSFTITKGSTILLEGTFGPSTLTGTDTSGQPLGTPGSSASGAVNLVSDSVDYTGGTYFDPALFSPNNGSLSISFKASGPIVASATQVNGFVANDVITFSALPLSVPEPSSVAGLGIGLLGLLGLGFLAIRRRNSVLP